MVKRNILLNPGPATTTDRVKLAQIVPDICPREKEFGNLMNDAAESLTEFVGRTSDYTTVLFGGSGTAAVESIISSVVGQGSLLVINNGAYGKRMYEIAAAYDLDVQELISLSHEPLDLISLESWISNSPKKITHLAAVHCETTTGLLNDVEAIGNICSRHDIKFIVDAMSSFAAVPLDMKQMNISFLAASSNKNLQGMAGISFVIANKAELSGIKETKRRNYYLNLYDQYVFFRDTKQMRFTPPVQTMYALKEATLELQEEGIGNRYKRYSSSWETLIDGLKKLKLSHLVRKEFHSRIVTAVVEPVSVGYDFEMMHEYFQKHNITIYPGKTPIANTFRVSNIGDLTTEDIKLFLVHLESYLKKINYF